MGINLPGHFIARHGEVLFDPFHKGRILAKADCEEILARQNLQLARRASRSRDAATDPACGCLQIFSMFTICERTSTSTPESTPGSRLFRENGEFSFAHAPPIARAANLSVRQQ